jgi:hypothetical protein
MALPKHGMSKTRTYKIWGGMIDRIEHPKGESGKRYGGRGITVSPKLRTFEGFLSVLGECPEGMSLDRINTNGNYEEGNVRWATASDQAKNRSTTVFYTYQGKTQCIRDWAIEYGIDENCLRGRLRKYGWPLEKALLAPRYAHHNPNPNKGKPRHW